MDQNTAQIIQDLFILQAKVREGREPEQVQEGIRTYLNANSAVIEKALAAYQALPESQRAEMQREHSELDYLAVSQSFYSLATRPLKDASIGRNITDDDLHMLDRALEFAKYVADTLGMEVAMQPVEAGLPREVRKYVRFERTDAGYDGHFSVSGGLTDENKDAFDSLEIRLSQGQRPLTRMAHAVVTPPGYKRTATEPFSTILNIPAETFGTVLSAVKRAGFDVKEA